jgi:hypothetical protein
MGLFFSVPKYIFSHHLLPYLPDYLDRLCLARTCKELFFQLSKNDTLIASIMWKDYVMCLHIIAEMGHYPSFDRLYLILSYKSPEVVKETYKTTNIMILMRLRLDCLSKDQFDENMLYYLYEKYGENIPECYFELLSSNMGRCAAFARLGCSKLFMKFSGPELLEDAKSFVWWNEFGKHVSYQAGRGGNVEICNFMIKTWRTFSDLLCEGIIVQGNQEIVDQLPPEIGYLIRNKKQKI